MNLRLGIAWVFENMVIYTREPKDNLDALQVYATIKRTIGRRKKPGEFLGAVKGLVPSDPYSVPYEYLRHTEAFLKRRRLKALHRKLGIRKREVRVLRKLTEWVPHGRGKTSD